MNLKAKLKCECIQVYPDCVWPLLKPVIKDSEENKTFAKFTPAGEMKLQITNPEALNFFQPGKEYILDITEVVAIETEPEVEQETVRAQEQV